MGCLNDGRADQGVQSLTYCHVAEKIKTRSEIAQKNFREVKIMREGIHPAYYQAKVVCNCGNEFVTGSTKQDIHVEVCSKCHSFYTGQQKAAAARGRIDKFNRKYGLNADK
jgi:large subunit ribosomal protein L31